MTYDGTIFDRVQKCSNVVKDLVYFSSRLMQSGGPGNNQVLALNRDFEYEYALSFSDSEAANECGMPANLIRMFFAIALLCELYEFYGDEPDDDLPASQMRNLLTSCVIDDDDVRKCMEEINRHSNDSNIESLRDLYFKHIVSWWSQVVQSACVSH